MCKHSVLLKEVIFRYHPKFNDTFRNNSRRRKNALANPEAHKVEALVEECFAAIGDYSLSRVAHRDFTDGSDSKTCSIRTSNRYNHNTFEVRIKSVRSVGGILKDGALRVTIYNPHNESLRYYYLPKDVWSTWNISANGGSQADRGNLRATYNLALDRIEKFDPYRCESFEELARKTCQS